jgi:hypothetical protein
MKFSGAIPVRRSLMSRSTNISHPVLADSKPFPRVGQGGAVRIASSIACDTQENTFNNLQTRPREKIA